jgi:hypothetical protein
LQGGEKSGIIWIDPSLVVEQKAKMGAARESIK